MKLACFDSPLGRISFAADNAKLIGLWFDGQKYDRRGLKDGEECSGDAEALAAAEAWLTAYFRGERPGFAAELSPRGTDFQKKVWAELMNIPYGETLSYGELAKRLCCKSARAVGSAVGKNPISLIIPCHRVVGSDGSLTGYAGGTDRKSFLLSLEGR